MKNVRYVLNRIKQGSEQGLKEVSVVCSKYTLLFVELLYIEGFISGYYKKEGLIFVILRYNQVGKGSFLKLSSNNLKPGYRSFRELKNLAFKGRYFVISSSLGFVYSRSYLSLLKGEGGFVVCEIL